MLLILVACYGPVPEEEDTSPPEGAVPTDAGLYDLVVAVAPDPPVVGDASMEVLVTAEGSPIAGADVAIVPFMPSMGHGLSEEPVVDEVGDGTYEADWVYPMAGEWEVTVTVGADPGTDTLTVTWDVG
ncbi:MAG: FixH family protein [Myxococcota bacterium]